MKSRLLLIFFTLLLTCTALNAQTAAQTAALSTAPSQAAQPLNNANLNVYLYRSPLTAAFFKANGAEYGTLLLRWREYLKQYGKAFQQTNRAELLAGLQPGVLVLGSAVLLDDQERAAIKAYADNGGNIVATWGTGARDAKGAWVGFGFIEALMDIKVDGSVSRKDEAWFLNIFGETPLNWSVPAGKRIYLGRTAESPLRVTSKNLAGRYLEWTRRPMLDESTGAISYVEKGASRRVFFGFSESSWEFDQNDDLPSIFDASFAWLRHQPHLFKAAWPQGYRAAQLLEMDTEDKYSNAENFARDLEAIQAKGTFYSVTSIARGHKGLVKELAAKHEVAYHGAVHVGFKGKSEEQQQTQIKKMIDDMQIIVGPELMPRITGFRAPTESFDAATEKLLRKNGIKHNVTHPENTDARLPFFSTSEENISPEQAIVVLPRTQNDDLNYIKTKKPLPYLASMMATELDYILEMGALGVLSVHSQNYATGGLLTKAGLMTQLTPLYLKRLDQNKDIIWVASGGDISEWWRARARVKLAASEAGPVTKLVFSVAAPGVTQGLSFFITHPSSEARAPTVSTKIAGLPQPKIKRLDAFRSAIIFEPLAAGNYAYEVRF